MNIKITFGAFIIIVLGLVPRSFAIKMDFKHHMGEIINSYLVIKNDLSSDKTVHVAEESKKIIQQAEEIEHMIKTTVHSGEFHRFHKAVDIQQLKVHAEKLSDQSIKNVRQHFKSISEIVVNYLELFGKPKNVTEDILYTFHCPMYDGGSDWVQTSKKTANPFYGSMMLTCGTLKSETAAKSGSKMMHPNPGSDSKHLNNHGKRGMH